MEKFSVKVKTGHDNSQWLHHHSRCKNMVTLGFPESEWGKKTADKVEVPWLFVSMEQILFIKQRDGIFP